VAVKRSKSRAPVRRKAATSDIVGGEPSHVRVPSKWKKHYDQLIRAREEFVKRQDGLVKDASEEQPAFSQHMADAGTDSFDRDLALSRASSEQDVVYEIDEALDRIQNGKYGICELTGKPIERERLDAIPWTRFCAAAEKQLENDGALRRAKLGARDSIARTSGTSEETGGEE
jgi:RNA polymerase-binding transcription factor DksA